MNDTPQNNQPTPDSPPVTPPPAVPTPGHVTSLPQPAPIPAPRHKLDPLPDDASLKEKAKWAIQHVYDPEIPINIYELGLIYDIDANENSGIVKVEMTLTTPNCPEAQSLPLSVKGAVESMDGVSEAIVNITWEPLWHRDMMSDAAKLQLGLL